MKAIQVKKSPLCFEAIPLKSDDIFYRKMIWPFSVLNHQKSNLFFTIWVVFWNVGKAYFRFFFIEHIKRNCRIFLLKLFPVIYFWWVIYSFTVIFAYKRLSICCSFRIFSIFFIIYSDCCSTLKAFIIIFLDGVYCCFFLCFLSNRENLHIIYHVYNLFHDICSAIKKTEWKVKSLPTIDVSNPIWCLVRSDSKSYLINLSAFS